MTFLTQLFQLLLTPAGLAGLVGGLILVLQARRSARLAWLLVSVGCFTASLAKFCDAFIVEPPALAFPLQQLREMGRPLTIALLGLLLLVAVLRPAAHRRSWLPRPLLFLMLVQAAIFFKTVLFGSVLFAFLAASTFGAVVAVIILGPSRWLGDDRDFVLAAQTIAGVGLIFVAANGYQALIDLHPITFVHGLLLGTTGNPQHAATLLAATIPAFIFLYEQPAGRGWRRRLWLAGLALVIGALVMTGSRTGLLMAAITVLLFYRRRIGLLLRIGLPVAIALWALVIVFDQSSLVGDLSLTSATGKILSETNTRQDVWAVLWRNFLQYPFFGVPLRGDRLFGYGESSWLGAAAAVGLAGFIPLLLFGLTSLQMLIRLYRISRRSHRLFLQTSLVISGLASLLAGSFFEAYLLGNLTFSLMALLLYLVLGHYIITVSQHHTAPSETPVRPTPAPWAAARANGLRPSYRTQPTNARLKPSR